MQEARILLFKKNKTIQMLKSIPCLQNLAIECIWLITRILEEQHMKRIWNSLNLTVCHFKNQNKVRNIILRLNPTKSKSFWSDWIAKDILFQVPTLIEWLLMQTHWLTSVWTKGERVIEIRMEPSIQWLCNTLTVLW